MSIGGGDRGRVPDAKTVIDSLGLRAHPEGGWYAETWRASARGGARPHCSAIVYLLAAGERSHWHRVDADEVWQYSAGDPLELRVWSAGVAEDAGSTGAALVTVHRLSGDLADGTVIQAVVPAGTWQAARPLGAWTLVGCIVTPAFEFAGFELAPPGWEPPVG